MSQDRPTPAPKDRLAFQWPTLLSFLTAFVATGTIALHLIGVVRHRQYLHFWGIDADLFPKATDWILINGYYGIVDRFSVILKTIIENWHWLGIASILIGAYIFVLQTPASNTPGKLKEWVLRRAEWQQRLARYIFLTTMAVAMTPLTLILLTAFMVIPAALGESGGTASAESMKIELMKGCELAKIVCIELRKDEKVISKGFVLDTSASYVAIFDTKIQRSRVIPLENIELVATRTLR